MKFALATILSLFVVSAHAEYSHEDCFHGSRQSVEIESAISARAQKIVEVATEIGAVATSQINVKAAQKVINKNLSEISQLQNQFKSANELALKSCQ